MATEETWAHVRARLARLAADMAAKTGDFYEGVLDAGGNPTAVLRQFPEPQATQVALAMQAPVFTETLRLSFYNRLHKGEWTEPFGTPDDVARLMALPELADLMRVAAEHHYDVTLKAEYGYDVHEFVVDGKLQVKATRSKTMALANFSRTQPLELLVPKPRVTVAA
ncbi:MAG: hypothetical protein WAX89_03885 [Alphaproteobacteria bacterium]